jgi:Metallo-peptidase family M12B Reprolysin-like
MMMRLIIAMLLLCAQPAIADTVIRVLGVVRQGSSVDGQKMLTQLTTLRDTWNNSGLSASSTGGITIQLVNENSPALVILPSLPSSGDIAQWAQNQGAMVAKRNENNADIVVFFVPGAQAYCGVVPQVSGWSRSRQFVAGSGGLDLRFAEDFWLAVVAPTPSDCPDQIAAHEVGHLLGAGHVNVSSSMYPDSQAWSEYFSFEIFGTLIQFGLSTAVADPLDCAPPLGVNDCTFMSQYSRPEPFVGNTTHNNTRTLGIVAESVANYRQGIPFVVLNPPVNVSGYLIEINCNWIPPYSGHIVTWQDDPQTNVPVTGYDIWYSQPAGFPFQYAWSIPYSQKYTPAYVWGANAAFRVSACSTTQCSGQSLSSYLAISFCSNPPQ